jgi:hypothetical protein
MATTTLIAPRYTPPIPSTMAELGVPETIVNDIMLRRLYRDGIGSLQSLSRSIKIALPIVETMFHQFRKRLLVEVKSMSGDDFNFSLTEAGRALAQERLELNQYSGPVPVSINDYHKMAKAQSATVEVDRPSLREMFSDIIVTDDLLDQVGPALISQNSLFLYGPTGNGKTTIAERLLRIYREPVLVPYAVEVDSQIILTFELGVHEPVEAEQLEYDPRWVLCKRPYIVVGGELVGHQLELQLDESTGIYSAPLQMKANNGMFLIDDFGRQVMTPRELLNRWIVPLDRRVDHLNLRHGVKFEIPFELMVVFSTNLDPDELADEAFLRRIQNKIYIEPVSAEVFDTIFESEAKKWQVSVRPEDMKYLRDLCLHKWHKPLRACYPRDVCQLLTSISQYERRPVRVTPDELERATQLYFTHQKAVEDV